MSNFILAKGLLCQFLQDEMQNVLASIQLLKLFKREAPIHVLAIFLTLLTNVSPPKKVIIFQNPLLSHHASGMPEMPYPSLPPTNSYL